MKLVDFHQDYPVGDGAFIRQNVFGPITPTLVFRGI